MKIIANEFVLPQREREGFECHASHFLPLGGGEVICVYFYGSKEGRDDVRIFGSRRSMEGIRSDPKPITEDDGLSHYNPVSQNRGAGTPMPLFVPEDNDRPFGFFLSSWPCRASIPIPHSAMKTGCSMSRIHGTVKPCSIFASRSYK